MFKSFTLFLIISLFCLPVSAQRNTNSGREKSKEIVNDPPEKSKPVESSFRVQEKSSPVVNDPPEKKKTVENPVRIQEKSRPIVNDPPERNKTVEYPVRVQEKSKTIVNDPPERNKTVEYPRILGKHKQDVNDPPERTKPNGHPDREPVIRLSPVDEKKERRPEKTDPINPEHIEYIPPISVSPEIVYVPFDDCIECGINDPVGYEPPLSEDRSAELLKNEGIKYFEEEKYPEALKLLSEAIFSSPYDLEIYFYRGCTEYNLSYYLSAICDLDIYISDFPKDGKAYYFRGLARYYSKDDAGALQDLNIASDLGDKNAKIFLKEDF